MPMNVTNPGPFEEPVAMNMDKNIEWQICQQTVFVAKIACLARGACSSKSTILYHM